MNYSQAWPTHGMGGRLMGIRFTWIIVWYRIEKSAVSPISTVVQFCVILVFSCPLVVRQKYVLSCQSNDNL